MNLSVFLIEADNMPKCDIISKADPYCVLSVTGAKEKHKSKYIKDTDHPIWNESFTFFVTDHKSQSLDIKLMDKDLLFDDPIANLTIDLSGIKPSETVDKWYDMTCVKDIKGNPRIHLTLTLS